MPAFTTTIEVEVEVDYYVEPGQIGGREDPSWEPYVESIEGVSLGGRSPDIQAMLSEEEQKAVFSQAEEHFKERDEQ